MLNPSHAETDKIFYGKVTIMLHAASADTQLCLAIVTKTLSLSEPIFGSGEH